MKIKYFEPRAEVVEWYYSDMIRTSDGEPYDDVGTGGSGTGGSTPYSTMGSGVDF